MHGWLRPISLFLLLRFSQEHDRKHSGYDESGNACPDWDEHAVYRDLPMKKEAKKMHDSNNREYDSSNSCKRFHDLSPPGRFDQTQNTAAICSTFLNSGSPVTIVALYSTADARTKQSA